MFGYTEHEHTVITSQTIMCDGVEVQLDVRRPQVNPHVLNVLADPLLYSGRREKLELELQAYSAMPDYLVLTHNGNPTYLNYEPEASCGKKSSDREEAMQRLNQDLARLIAEPGVDLKALQWSKLIQNDTGYDKDGSITMY